MKNLNVIFDFLLFPFLFLAKCLTPILKRWMISIAMFTFLLFSPMQVHAVDIWVENFTGQNDKGAIGSSRDTAGVSWTIDVSSTTLGNSNDWFSVKSEAFDGRDLDGAAIWDSPSIDISAYKNVNFSLDAAKSGGGMESSDYVDIHYSIDDGAFTRIPNYNGSGDGSHTLIDDFDPERVTQSIGIALSLKIRVIIKNNGGQERYKFDNVLVTGDIASDNNPPTDITLSNNEIDENNAIGDVIGSLTTADVDGEDNHIYSIVSSDGNFIIDGNQLKAGEAFDYEEEESYTVRIKTDDGNGGTYEEDFTIVINDVHENSEPTNITLSDNDIDENNAVGDVIGNFSTTDADAEDDHAYTFVAGDGDTNNGSFTIDGNQLKAGEAFDYEEEESYTVRIKTDDGNGGTFEKNFTITINDKTECLGCDCSLDDNDVNNASPGIRIPELHGATTDTTKCISGMSDNDEDGDDDRDYYSFIVQKAGTLEMTTTSPNNHDYKLKIWKNDSTHYGESTNDVHNIDDMSLEAGDEVIVRFEESGSGIDQYQITFDFTLLNTGCDNSLDSNANNSDPGVRLNALHEKTANASTCISGSSSDDDKEYYYFNPGANGTLKIITSSPNGHEYHFDYYHNGNWDDDDTGENRNFTIDVVKDDRIKVWVKETGDDTDWWQIRLEFTAEAVAETPPVMRSINDKRKVIDVPYTLDISNYVELTNGDPILSYALTGALPAGLSFDTTTGLLSGTPTQLGDFPLIATASDNDGVSNEEDFILTIILEEDEEDPVIVENADDLCYEDFTYGGKFCMDMGMCKGGMGCTTTYPLRNINPDNNSLTNVNVLYNENGMGGTMAGDCAVTPDGNCTQEDDIEMGPVGMLGTATSFYFNDEISTTDEDAGISTTAKMAMSCLNSSNLYAYYTIDDVQYRGEVKSCDPEELGEGEDRPFTIRNPDDTRNITGNYAIIGNTNQCALKSEKKDPPWTGECYQSGSNNRPSRFLDFDSDDTTVNSTKSTLNIPADAEVVFAGLYWQGVVHNSDRNTDFMDGETISGEEKFSSGRQINFAANDDDNTYGADEVLFKVPGGGYATVTASRQPDGDKARGFDYHKLGYAGFQDVTSLLDVDNPNGDYFVADIKSHQGVEGNHGNYASWSLVVIYTKSDESFRNITLFDGYATVDGNFDEDLVLDGFLTQRIPPINSKLAMFVLDGDGGKTSLTIVNEAGESTLVNNDNSLFDSTISDSILRTPNDTSLRTDLRVIELNDVLNPTETKATLKPRSGGDRYTPSFFIMSAELIKPDLCYDYSYQQNGRYFTEENDGSKDPYVKGSLFSRSPVSVSVYIKNREDSDFTIKNMKISIKDIDTVQATYIDDTSEVTYNGKVARQSVDPQSSGESFINEVPIGELGGEEDFYFYYDLDPKANDIDMPINAYLDYDATFELPDGRLIDLPPYTNQKVTHDIPLCVDGNFSYSPVKYIFNVEEQNLGKYNIHTQVARRVDNFAVKSYDAVDTDTPSSVSSIVAVELIDAGAYHETQTSCQQPDSSLTPRVWVTFNNSTETAFTSATISNAIANGFVSDTILSEANPIAVPEDFYGTARRNTAFRISYMEAGDGSLLKLNKIDCNNPNKDIAPCFEVNNFPDLSKVDVGAGKGICTQDIDGNPNSADTISSYCGNAGQGIDSQELSKCMECVYGWDLYYVCSRDNFAIRPKAFKISMNDDNTSDVRSDFANNTDKSGDVATPVNIVTGYPYAYDINATNFIDETPVEGYVQSFDSTDPTKRAYMMWNPSQGHTVTGCNAAIDSNMSFSLVDGSNANPNPINTWGDKHDTLNNVGEYEFRVIDREWTKYDWDENLTKHHNNGGFISNSTPDCIENNNDTPTIGGNAVANKPGCDTSSIHEDTYKALSIQSHPYEFKVSGLGAGSIGARPTNDESNNSFVYMNTLDQTLYVDGIDENMSYNVQGTFSAISFTDKELSNFVDDCYAEDVNMELIYSYNHDAPADTLTYDIIDYNTTDSSVVYRPRENNTLNANNIIVQSKNHFGKEMNGGITMDLGYNYARTYDAPINPIQIDMSDFNITYATQPATLFVEGKDTHEIFGDVKIDRRVSFLYARAKPSQTYYETTEDNIDTPISVVVYCDLGFNVCQDRGILSLLAQTNENNWWKSWDHNNQDGRDGNIELKSDPVGALITTGTSISSEGVDNSINVIRGVAVPPLTVPVNLVGNDSANYIDRWLIYNPDNATELPTSFYRVRFINDAALSGWSGHGKTGNVVGDDINSKKTRRLEW